MQVYETNYVLMTAMKRCDPLNFYLARVLPSIVKINVTNRALISDLQPYRGLKHKATSAMLVHLPRVETGLVTYTTFQTQWINKLT